MRRESKRQPEHGRELRAEQTRAQQPDRHIQTSAGHRPNALPRRSGLEVALQLLNVLRELLGTGRDIASQGARSQHVGPGRSAEAEIDAPRIQRRQRTELFGDDQRRVIRQHDAAGTDADGPGAAGHVADDQRGRGAGDPRHVVVLGQPVALETQALRMLCQRERVAQSLGGAGALGIGERSRIESGIMRRGLISASRRSLRSTVLKDQTEHVLRPSENGLSELRCGWSTPAATRTCRSPRSLQCSRDSRSAVYRHPD